MLKHAFAVVFLFAGYSFASAADTDSVSYHRDVEPIFRAHCQGCHQGAKKGGEFMMTSHAALLLGGESAQVAVQPGEPDASYLVELITPAGGEAEMPQNAPPLSEQQIAKIREWIKQGAKDDSPPSPPGYSPDNLPTYSRAPLTTTLDASSGGKWVATSGFHEVVILNAQTLVPSKRLVGLSERIESVRFSPDGLRLAVAGGSPGRFGEVQVWEVESGELLLSKQLGYDTIASVAWSPDGKLIAIGCSDNTLRAIKAADGEQVLHQGAHEDWLRACVFTPDGEHLLSAARDMTVKLTEVKTQRFVDNVTSITPGALRGGVNSLSMHPKRPEFLVGGADGTPKVYRVFRETERRIGDDANLVRRFPAMRGRVFATAISKDGNWLAAASTLDGASHVAIYPYSFDAKLPDDVKAAMAKRVSDRSASDKKLVEDYVANAPAVQAEVRFETASIYSLAFSNDSSSILAGGSDGVVRRISVSDGKVMDEVVPVEIDAAELADSTADTLLKTADGMQAETAVVAGISKATSAFSASDVVGLDVQPAEIQFSDANGYVQLVVMARLAEGGVVDVTRTAKIVGRGVTVSKTGLIRPSAAGDDNDSSSLSIAYAGQTVELACRTIANESPSAIDFVSDVNPILSRLGCNSGTCHGSQKGKNGFQLSLRGYDPVGDIRALSDDLVSRRLNTAAPDASLMLLKPLGTVPHEGGVLLTRDSVYYSVLRKWIAEGAKLDTKSEKVASIEVFPKNPVIDREGAWQQFRIVATYPNGTRRDVSREAFIESGNSEVVVSHATGLVEALRRGEAPILARYEGAYAATTVTVMGDRTGFVWREPKVDGDIDRLVASKWQRMKILPSELCNDSEFLRRVYLDLTGLPPTSEELKAFLRSDQPQADKRSQKIDQLIGSKEFVDHWTNKWADLLQVNSKFLGKDGARAFRDWIREAVAENRPYDQFVREVLTASGSNKDNPAAAYYKILRDPDLMMENTTHLFLAVRFNCNKCHDHPFERWTQDQYYELAAYFAQTELKPDPASKGKKIGGTAVEGAKPLYELVGDADYGEMEHVRTGNVVPPAFPYDCDYSTDEDATRRQHLAAWMTSPDNQYFAKSYVNRLWGYLTGTGLMEPIDDIRAGNPPTNPALISHLTDRFVESGFDTESILREICNSRTYQLSVGSTKWNVDDTLNYSHAKARRLPAEVLFDSVYQVTGAISQIPGVAAGTRAAELPDVAIGLPDGFLNNLGRPVRESACECERSDGLQLGPIMALVSGPTVGKAISDPACAIPGLASGENSTAEMIREIYFRVLSRAATDEEVEAILGSEQQIELDHARLGTQLAERETWWKKQKAVLEEARLNALADTKKAVRERTEAIADQRTTAEAKRVDELKVAEAALSSYESDALGVANQYLDKDRKRADWYPLAARKLESSNKAVLKRLSDRSILASGAKGKGSYTLEFDLGLSAIGGLRLEALPIDGIPGGGPGLPSNGNFVVTELEAFVAPRDAPDEKKKFELTTAAADFTQAGFNPKQVLDGNKTNQKGWAVSPSGGIVHWAVLGRAEPLQLTKPSVLTIVIHQNHNAADHRLGHFRISATQSAGELPLGFPEEFESARVTAAKSRDAKDLAPLISYLKKSDDNWLKLQQTVVAKKKPLPKDAEIVRLEARATMLGKETPDDSQLTRLRSDFAASQGQLKNKRLTLAQDLTWALINSPAFLFNR